MSEKWNASNFSSNQIWGQSKEELSARSHFRFVDTKIAEDAFTSWYGKMKIKSLISITMISFHLKFLCFHDSPVSCCPRRKKLNLKWNQNLYLLFVWHRIHRWHICYLKTKRRTLPTIIFFFILALLSTSGSPTSTLVSFCYTPSFLCLRSRKKYPQTSRKPWGSQSSWWLRRRWGFTETPLPDMPLSKTTLSHLRERFKQKNRNLKWHLPWRGVGLACH